MELLFIIPDDKAHRLVEAINALYPQPDELDLSDAQWAKEFIRRWLIGQVQKHEKMQAMNAVRVDFDDSLISG